MRRFTPFSKCLEGTSTLYPKSWNILIYILILFLDMTNISKSIEINVFLLLSTLLITGCFGLFDTTFSKSYQNYEEAVADGAMERGWIPDSLPASAVNIWEKHDLDTNETILKFDVDRTESTNLIRDCQTVDTVLKPKKLTAKWWSNNLVSSADTYFYCDEDNAYMVVDNNTIYYWRSY